MKAARKGHAEAAATLATFTFMGRGGLKKDPKRAVTAFTKVADKYVRIRKLCILSHTHTLSVSAIILHLRLMFFSFMHTPPHILTYIHSHFFYLLLSVLLLLEGVAPLQCTTLGFCIGAVLALSEIAQRRSTTGGRQRISVIRTLTLHWQPCIMRQGGPRWFVEGC